MATVHNPIPHINGCLKALNLQGTYSKVVGTDSKQDERGGCHRVDFSSHELETFSFEINQSITWEIVTDLDLAFNDLETLPAELASSIPNIKKIDISGNNFQVLPEVLGQLTSLVSLTANESSICRLPSTIGNLKALTCLSLIGNTLVKIGEAVQFPENLEILNLDENNLKSLPECICSLRHLRVLEATENSIMQLPENFGRLCRLEVLNLSHNDLTYLPESFALLANVQIMDVSHNKIKSLTESFASAPHLRILYASYNRLDCLPPWTSDLKTIETFSVKDNSLFGKPLEEGFCQNSKDTLKKLELGGNFIEFLPSAMGLLSRVEVFHLGSTIPELERRDFQNGNCLKFLPDDFGGMVSLTKVRLDENQFEKLPDTFGNLINLVYLDLGQNRLRYLPDSFPQLRSLQTCLLSKNCLQELPKDFGKLSQLKELSLDSNEIKELPESFGNLTNLKTLDLFENHLSEIPGCLQSLKQLTALDLDCNSFDIDELEVPKISSGNYYSADRKKFGAGSAKDSNGTSALWLALKNRKTIWAAHGETEDRSRKKSHPNQSEEKEILSSAEECLNNLEGGENLGDGITMETEEDWDKELEDESPYDMVNIYEHPVTRDAPRGKPVVDFFFVPSDEHPSGIGETVFDKDIQDGQFDDAD